MADGRAEAVDLVVLCGGRGTRLGALTAATPKSLLPVGGAPFLLHQLLALKEERVGRILLAAHHLAGDFREFLHAHRKLLPDVTVVEEPVPLGTGGALRHAAQQVGSRTFLALNGDSWLLQPLEPVMTQHAHRHAAFTMVVVRAEQMLGTARAKGRISLGPQDDILDFSTEAGQADGWINAGRYVIDTDLVLTWPAGRYDLEDRFMSLVPPGRGCAFRSNASLLDIGTPECYALANRLLVAPEAAAR